MIGVTLTSLRLGVMSEWPIQTLGPRKNPLQTPQNLAEEETDALLDGQPPSCVTCRIPSAVEVVLQMTYELKLHPARFFAGRCKLDTCNPS